ncbi:MAG TPA: erythromycin esterase family protein [Thermoanaerobaculia bacterium]|nr:erythromycin esterase family protein [Thermoanaerobaculia bacterium]
MKRLVLFALLFPVIATAQIRRHAAAPPAEPAPAQWLAAHAHPLTTTEATGDLSDLEPLRDVAGGAHIVALADGTHGTHEYFTSKLRLIQFLVTEMGFDTLAMEHTMVQIERADAYVHGGAVDIRSALFPQDGEVDYPFWHVEEFVAVLDWMRDYNATHDHPISIVGIDVYDGVPASAEAVKYLQSVDAAAASVAIAKYACLPFGRFSDSCIADASFVRDEIAANEPAYVSRSSQRDFDDALQNATVAVQDLEALDPAARNHNMAINVAWALDHRSESRRIIVWGHGEHFGKTVAIEKVDTAGVWLDRMFGADYVALGNAMWSGVYLGYTVPPQAEMFIPVVDPDPQGYENFFVQSAAPAFLLPLHQPLHSFLMRTRPLRTAGFSVDNNWDYPIDLEKKFDALVYVALTTPTHPLPAPAN